MTGSASHPEKYSHRSVSTHDPMPTAWTPMVYTRGSNVGSRRNHSFQIVQVRNAALSETIPMSVGFIAAV